MASRTRGWLSIITRSTEVIPATPAAVRPGAVTLLPGNWWNNGEFKDQLDPATYIFTTLGEMFARDMAVAHPREYVSPDGSLVLPAYRNFMQGPPNHLGWRFSDALDTYGFVTARPGSGRVLNLLHQMETAAEGAITTWPELAREAKKLAAIVGLSPPVLSPKKTGVREKVRFWSR